MSLPDLPLWLWVVLVAESGILGWLTFRFGGRGLAWGALAATGFWFALSLGGSFLISRLEGSQPGADLLPGAVLGMAHIGAVAAPLALAAAAVGALLRRRIAG